MQTLYEIGEIGNRPWGSWKVLSCGPGFCFKRIAIKSSGVLSLQLHNHRREHWSILEGEALVTLGEETFVKRPGDDIYIPEKTIHRVSNETGRDLVFVELQTGPILDEKDIVRFEDYYGRVNKQNAG